MEAVGIDVYKMVALAGWDIYPIGSGAKPQDVPKGTLAGIGHFSVATGLLRFHTRLRSRSGEDKPRPYGIVARCFCRSTRFERNSVSEDYFKIVL
jgi:hypothetical protein